VSQITRDTGPPDDEGPPPQGPNDEQPDNYTTTQESTARARRDGGADRRESALRSTELHSRRRDPETADTRYHRPCTGLRADGFREGFRAGALDALRIMWTFLSDDGRAKAGVIASRYGRDDD
jgi:hypothetical protein